MNYPSQQRRSNKIEKTAAEIAQAASDNNEQLCQLLKECQTFFEEENPKDFTVLSERMEDLLTRIDEVLK